MKPHLGVVLAALLGVLAAGCAESTTQAESPHSLGCRDRSVDQGCSEALPVAGSTDVVMSAGTTEKVTPFHKEETMRAHAELAPRPEPPPRTSPPPVRPERPPPHH